MKITIGDYLIKRLKEIGITDLIGVPGDFNLQFLEQIRASEGIRFVGTSNELNAAYAADGYARERGVAAMAVTYGVGDLGAIGGVAGSAAEHVPVIVITGAPPHFAVKHNYKVHHSLADGDFENIETTYAAFTAAQALITYENAQSEIDRLFKTAIQKRVPVELQLPSNLSFLIIDVEDKPLDLALTSDPEQLDKVVEAITNGYQQAGHPLVLVDMAVDRYGIVEETKQLIDKLNLPFAAMSTGKAILDENHPLYAGTYKGDESEPGVKKLVESSDWLLTVAPRFIEWNSGTYTVDLPEEKVIRLGRTHTFVGSECFEGVMAKDIMKRLSEAAENNDLTPQTNEPINQKKPLLPIPESDQPLRHETLWEHIRHFLKEGDIIYAETGTASQALGAIPLPPNTTYVASLIWGAIGFTLPAVFGSLLAAPEKRQLLFIGDGSLQVTAPALGRILYHEQNPLIFVINNDGYTIERYIMGMDAAYNDIPEWQYHRLPEVFSNNCKMLTFDIHTHGELADALEKAESATHGVLIELHLPATDAPDPLKKFGPAVADFNFGDRGPENPEPEDTTLP